MTMTPKKENQKEYLRAWYDKTGSEYDGYFSDRSIIDGHSEELRGVASLLVPRYSRVLDVGTGTAEFMSLLSTRTSECYGADISRNMLLSGQLKLKDMKTDMKWDLVSSDAMYLPFRDDWFDLTISIGMIEYYSLSEVCDHILEEFKRVTIPSGSVIVDFPVHDAPQAGEFKEKSEGVGTKVFLYSPEQIEAALLQAGFDILKRNRAGWEYQFLLRVNHK
jgi:ubiquinone/menaquinone biosynthesis C-methylase UbiE